MNAGPSRIETDSLGRVGVPAGVLWGAQTARALQASAIGTQRMPMDVIHAIAWLKWAAAVVNGELGALPEHEAQAIAGAALRVAGGQFDGEFPLTVWQTGSGTQSHMNVSEVIARLACEPPRAWGAASVQVDAQDDVNLGQSTNDVFSGAMHVAVALRVKSGLLPALQQLRSALARKSDEFGAAPGTGQHPPQGAAPPAPSLAFDTCDAQLDLCEDQLRHALGAVHGLAIGSSTAAAGRDRPTEFGPRVVALLAQRLQLPLVLARNPRAAMPGHEALVALHGALRLLAITLGRMAGDTRLPGSSPTPPGTVQPAQAEALSMVCAQVIGHDAAIGFAASQASMAPNICRPLIVLDVLDSLRLLTDAMYGFSEHGVMHLQADAARVPAQGPDHGHDKRQGATLRDAALALGPANSTGPFDVWVAAGRLLAPQPQPQPQQRPRAGA